MKIELGEHYQYYLVHKKKIIKIFETLEKAKEGLKYYAKYTKYDQ